MIMDQKKRRKDDGSSSSSSSEDEKKKSKRSKKRSKKKSKHSKKESKHKRGDRVGKELEEVGKLSDRFDTAPVDNHALTHSMTHQSTNSIIAGHLQTLETISGFDESNHDASNGTTTASESRPIGGASMNTKDFFSSLIKNESLKQVV